MADNERELKLRVVPELDQQAKKQVEDDLDTISGNIPVGGKGDGSETAIRKQRLADIRAEIDLIDLKARKEGVASIKRVDAIRSEMALGKIALEAGQKAIAEEESMRSQASQQAIKDMNQELALAQQLNLTKAESASIQRKVFFATDRLDNGFTTMSRSMTGLVSNTKDANIAFANFGRIVQDAPFGLLGISNNIDPLLNSFQQLKMETGGTGAALKAMGSQLIGPAGLIFLIGSVLPTALLFAQKYMGDVKKESSAVADAIKRVNDEFAKLSAEAAGDVGLPRIQQELEANEKTLDAINKKIGEFSQGAVQAASSVAAQGVSYNTLTRGVIAFAEAQNKEQITRLEAQRDIILGNQEQLKTQKATLEQEQEIARIRSEFGVSISLQQKEQNESEIKRLTVLAEMRKLQIEFNQTIMESRDAYLAAATAVKAAQQAEEEAFKARVRREAGRGREPIGDDSEFARGLAQREALEQQRIKMLRASGREEQAITLETEIAKRDARVNLLKLGITDAETINNALALISQEGAQRIRDNELTVADARSEAMTIYADAVASGLGAIFGENKAVQSAQVVIDTIAGAQKTFAALMPNFPLAVAGAAAVTAQGISALRRINSTTKGSKSLGSSSSASAPSSGPKFVTDNASIVAGSISPFGVSSSPNINISAKLDRAGLALAVRDGEADIATQQIPFAS